MEYVIAVYRSRNVAIRTYNYLSAHGVTCALVPTPRAAGVGCGLSVKLAKGDYLRLRAVLDSETFAGFFLVKLTLHGNTVTRI